MQVSLNVKKRVFSTRGTEKIIAFFAAAFYLQNIFSQGTHNSDYYVSWIEQFTNGGLFTLYHVNLDEGEAGFEGLTVPYPPFSLYILGLVTKIISPFSALGSQKYLVASNLTSMIFIFLTFFLLLWWREKSNIKSPVIFLVTPSIILISPILGYQDPMVGFFILAAFISIENRKTGLAGCLCSMAIFSKQLALIPIFGLLIFVVIILDKVKIRKFFLGITITSTLILSPFISTGTLDQYLRAQGLASVHTMLSANNPNLPWLFGIILKRVLPDLILFSNNSQTTILVGESNLRKFLYLLTAVLFIATIFVWVVIQIRRKFLQHAPSFVIGAICVSSYNLFCLGVHENHVYMLLPLLFALSSKATFTKAYAAVSLGLAINLVMTRGPNIAGGSIVHEKFLPISVQVILSLIVLSLYSYAHIKIYKWQPNLRKSIK